MNLFNDENINEILNGLIKIGEVSSVDYAKGTARVVFDDDDGIVSYDLPVLQKNTIKNKDYAMPDAGEDVLCLFLPSGVEEGFILGSIYAGEITPPESSGNKRTVVFSDGTKISYDRETHTLSATVGGTSFVANNESFTVTAPKIKFNGDVEINGSVTSTGDNVAAGISTTKHTHTGNLGSPTSAPIGG